MKGFLYFAPGAHAFSAELPERLGLSSLLGRQVSGRGVGTGPDGNPGVILGREGVDVRFREEGQVWLAAEKYWVGCEENALPGPEDLLRENHIGGHPVEMGDKGTWLVPILRSVSGVLIPDGQRFVLGADGHWGRELSEEFLALGSRVEAVWEQFAQAVGIAEPDAEESTELTLTLDDELGLIVEALAFNYRVGQIETHLLGLLTARSVPDAIEAMIDVPGIKEIVKKNPPPESPDSTSGAGES